MVHLLVSTASAQPKSLEGLEVSDAVGNCAVGPKGFLIYIREKSSALAAR
jgi:hypothetical protein